MRGRFSRMGLRAVVLLILALSIGQFLKGSRSWSILPLPPDMWGFYELDIDGPREVAICRAVGCVAFCRIAPGGHLAGPPASTRRGTVR